MEPAEDVEIVEVTCLCCKEVFRSSSAVREMVGHCKEVHELNLDEVRKKDCECLVLALSSGLVYCDSHREMFLNLR